MILDFELAAQQTESQEADVNDDSDFFKNVFPSLEQIRSRSELEKQRFIKNGFGYIANKVEACIRNQETSAYGNFDSDRLTHRIKNDATNAIIIKVNEVQDYGVCLPDLGHVGFYTTQYLQNSGKQEKFDWSFHLINNDTVHRHQQHVINQYLANKHGNIFSEIFNSIRKRNLTEGRNEWGWIVNLKLKKDGFEIIFAATQPILGTCKFVFESTYPEEDLNKVIWTVKLQQPDGTVLPDTFVIEDPTGNWLDEVLTLWRDPITMSRQDTKIEAKVDKPNVVGKSIKWIERLLRWLKQNT